MSFPVTIYQLSAGADPTVPSSGINVTVYSGVPGTDGTDGVGVPAGGTTGQALVKATDADFDTAWATVSGGGGGGTGTVTSVALAAPNLFTVAGSPVSTAGTIALTLNAQAANTVLAGPTGGANAAPAMRSLVAADLPANVAYLDKAGQTFTQTTTFASGITSPSTTTSGSFVVYSSGMLVGNTSVNIYLQTAFVGGAGAYFSLQPVPATGQNGPGLKLSGGDGYSSGDWNGGNLILSGGAPHGTGGYGSVQLVQRPSQTTDILQVTDSASAKKVWVDSAFVLHGDGSALTNLNADNLASGTLSDARLSANVPLLTAGKLSASVLPTSGVTAGSYTLASITVDAEGRVTAASSGSAGGTGTVTSVGLSAPAFLTVANSPVTTSGTLALTLATQAANLVFAGPSTGADAAPTFRSLALADLPTITASDVGAQPADAELTAIAGLTSAADQLPYFTGSGTAALTTLSSASRTLLASADAGAARSALGLGSLATKSTVTLTTDVTGVLPTGNLPTTLVKDGDTKFPGDRAWVLAQGADATAGTSKTAIVILPRDCIFKGVMLAAKTGPVGADLIIDIKLNGTSLWATNTGNRPKIAAGSTTGSQSSFDTTAAVAGGQLTIDIVQVGSTTPGQTITVVLYYDQKN